MATTQYEFPSGLVFNSKIFRPRHFQQNNPIGQGFNQTLDRTIPQWYAEYTTPPLADTRYDQAIAFLASLKGMTNTFLGWDPRRPMPRAYQTLSTAADPWTQTGYSSPAVGTIDNANSFITLNQMQNGAVVTSGDYFSFQLNSIWWLFRVIGFSGSSAQSVAASGNSITVKVDPVPVVSTPGSLTPVRYRKACCEMKMIGDYNETDQVDSKPILSFKATQFINRGI